MDIAPKKVHNDPRAQERLSAVPHWRNQDPTSHALVWQNHNQQPATGVGEDVENWVCSLLARRGGLGDGQARGKLVRQLSRLLRKSK